jgi:hypothetical protein
LSKSERIKLYQRGNERGIEALNFLKMKLILTCYLLIASINCFLWLLFIKADVLSGIFIAKYHGYKKQLRITPIPLSFPLWKEQPLFMAAMYPKGD